MAKTWERFAELDLVALKKFKMTKPYHSALRTDTLSELTAINSDHKTVGNSSGANENL